MVKIVVDSGCDIPKSMVENEHCQVDYVPLNLQLEDCLYIDDEELDMEVFLNHMESSPVYVKSSSPSPSLFMEKFKEGDSVFVVTLSSFISGTYSNAVMAKNMYLEEYGKKFIHVFDSLSASVGEGLVALKIAEFAKKGLSNLEIVDNVNYFITHMKTYFILDKYDTLVKSGRINPYVAKLAAMLNIKPICGSDQGKITLFDKVRGYNKAVKRMIEMVKEEVPDIEDRIVAISHTRCIEKALAIKDELLRTLRAKDVIIVEARGLIATYASRGGCVLSV